MIINIDKKVEDMNHHALNIKTLKTYQTKPNMNTRRN